MKMRVKLSELKKLIKDSDFKKQLTEHVGFTHPRSLEKWISRNNIPLFQQKRVAEFLERWQAHNE